MLVEPQIIAVKACASKQNAFDKPQLEVVNIIKGYGWIIYQSKPNLQLTTLMQKIHPDCLPLSYISARFKYEICVTGRNLFRLVKKFRQQMSNFQS